MLSNFITTPGGEELAVISRAEYEALIDAADEKQGHQYPTAAGAEQTVAQTHDPRAAVALAPFGH